MLALAEVIAAEQVQVVEQMIKDKDVGATLPTFGQWPCGLVGVVKLGRAGAKQFLMHPPPMGRT